MSTQRAIADLLLAQTLAQDLGQDLVKAEQTLGVQPGTLTALFSDSDYLCVMKMTAALETALNSRVEQEMTRSSGGFGGGGAGLRFVELAKRLTTGNSLGGKYGLLNLAGDLNIMLPLEREFCTAVLYIRNAYAHSIENYSKSIPTIIGEAKNVDQLLKQLKFGLKTDFPPKDDRFFKFQTILTFGRVLVSLQDQGTPYRGLLNVLVHPVGITSTATLGRPAVSSAETSQPKPDASPEDAV